ncbi:MAG TPA: hypothetical protein VG733_10705 [Chthoniobacteraceae bacterium]|nr:hypothetical protein [Chthoniobacteraceae bacterium]
MMRALNKSLRLPAVLTILAATFAVYWPSLQNQFVWDDTALILRDPFIRSWRLIPQGIGHFLFTDATPSDFYRPIQRLVYTLDYALFAFHPWGYHLTNILVHAAAAVMLFFFVEQLIARTAPSDLAKNGFIPWAVALAWAVHPVHSEAVMYIASLADLLVALFWFAGLYFGLLSLKKGLRPVAWAAGFCFLCAALSKESGLAVIAVWLAMLLCLHEFKSAGRWLLIGAGIVGVWCALRFTAEHIPPPVLSAPSTLAERPALVMRAADAYAGLLIAPVDLHMERDVPAGMLPLLLGGAVIVAFAFWTLRAYRHLFAAFIFLVAFLIAYAPMSNIFSLNAHVAEHWLYFSSAFLFAAEALSLASVRVPRVALIAAYGCWLVFLGARTFLRNHDWKDQRTFVETTIVTGGDTARMWVNLGQLDAEEAARLQDPAKLKIAIADYQKALEKRPGLPFAVLGLATTETLAGDFDNALKHMQQVEVIPFLRAQALTDRAALEARQTGTTDLPLLLKAATLDPDNWDVQKIYIKKLAESGNIDGAVAAARAVVEKQPWRARSWKVMTRLLMAAGRKDLAVHAYEEAQDCDVHLNMANDD